jgi:hypothetical protein
MSKRPLRVLVLLVLVAGSALADAVPGFELERFVPNPGARETLALSTGDSLPAQSLRVSLLGHYEQDPLVFTVAGVRSGAAIASRVTVHVLGAYALTDWAEVALSLPVVVWQGGDDLSARHHRPRRALGAGPLHPAARVGWQAPRSRALARPRRAAGLSHRAHP